MGELSKFVKRR